MTPSLPFPLLLLITSLPFILILSLYINNLRRRRRRRGPSEQQQAALDLTLTTDHQDLAEGLPHSPTPQGSDVAAVGVEAEKEQSEGEGKRRKKKGRKKRGQSTLGLEGDGRCGERAWVDCGVRGDGTGKESCQFPFSSFASATQRKIKLQYDQLVMSDKAKVLSMAQVGQFVNCLVEARNDLQHKSEVIQRSFKIKKALLFRADRSSFDRLCQQVCKLETEHKRLEQDAAVFNLLQEQLKLSPAYKTLLEIGAKMDLKAKSVRAADICDITFEEFLAQEKKDSFWQKYGKQRS